MLQSTLLLVYVIYYDYYYYKLYVDVSLCINASGRVYLELGFE